MSHFELATFGYHNPKEDFFDMGRIRSDRADMLSKTDQIMGKISVDIDDDQTQPKPVVDMRPRRTGRIVTLAAVSPDVFTGLRSE